MISSNGMKWVAAINLVVVFGLLSSCSAKPTTSEQSEEIKALKAQVNDALYQNFSFSEIEVYLPRIQEIPDQEMLQFSAQVCESLRRGQSWRTIRYELTEKGKLDDIDMIYAMIAVATEKNQCPESDLPKTAWRKSLLALRERLNGGKPLSLSSPP
jgi:hypothetical protein